MSETEDYDKSATPTAHASSHENGGTDEISVTGLAGTLADAQTPAAHKTSHQDGGSDEISVTGLAGLLVTAQTPAAHKTSHQDGGSDEISVTGLAGLLVTAQTPTGHHTSHEPGGSDILAALAPAAHKTSHQDGGSDEISVAGLSGTLADAQTPAAHKTSHQDGGTDEISVAGLAGQLADPQTSLFQKARAYCGAAQSIPDDAITKVNIDTASFDPASIVDASNKRIKPTLAGYYQVNGNVAFGPGCTAIQTYLFKNGNINSRAYLMYVSGNNFGGMVSDLIYCNGSTDYLELHVYQLSGVARDLDILSATNYLSVVGPF